MAFQNKLKAQVDLPVWEWTRFAPTTTAKPSAAVSDWKRYFVGGTSRYGYYMVGLVLYRYDTQSDSWHLLSAPPITAPVYDMALEYAPNIGYAGTAIGPGPDKNTIQMAGLTGDTLVGSKIVITGGTGAGQERTIVDVATPVVHDSGIVTVSTAGPPALIQDTSVMAGRKTWQYNQWRNYQMRLVHASGPGQNQIRKVLYNTTNALYYSDYNHANLHGYYAAPLVTTVTALATWYQIESSVVYVDSNWAIPPDSTSRFMVKSGGLWMMAGLASAPYYTLQYYDIAADMWYLKGSQQTTLYSATWDTYENAIEVVTEVEAGATTDWVHASPLTANIGSISTVASPYNMRTLVDASQNMPINKYANQMIKITGGTGRGQSRTIVGNNRTTFIISRDWDVVPDSTSTYQVIGDSDKIYLLPGRAQSTMGIYSAENDVVTTGRQYDFGTSRTMFADLAPKGIGSVTVTNGGTGGAYAVGDILTLTNNGLYTGIGGKVKVETLSGNQVATVSVLNIGAGYIVSGTAYATTSGNEGGGNGTGCTITIVSNALPSQPPIGITGITASAAANIGGLLTVTPTTAGTGYSVDDLLTLPTGTGGIVRVTAVNSVGGVTACTVEQQGYGYTNATEYTASAVTTATAKNGAATDFRAAATGARITVTITMNAVATTGISHNLKIGDVVWIGGLDTLPAMSSQTWVGGLRTVAGVPSSTTFTYSIGGPAAATAATVTVTTATNYAITAAVVNAAGTGYSVGDLLTCTTGGSGGTVRVTAVNAGAVTGVCLVTRGQGYSSGSSATSGGGGSSCTITLTAATTGVVNSLVLTTAGQGFGIITSAAISPTYTVGTGIARASVYNGGSGYAPGDLLSVSGGGDNGVYGYGGVVKVLTTTAANVTPAGAVLTVQIMSFGQGYTTGEKTTTTLGNTFAATFCGMDGGGTGCTINVDAVGSVYSCATAGGNNLLVNVTGVTSAGAMSTVAVADGGTGYTTSTAYTLVASAAAAIFNAETANTSQVVDTTKNWQPNELVGKLVQTQVGGVASAVGGIRRIIANSSHTIYVQPVLGVAQTSGATKYVIFDAKSLGTESSYKTIEKQAWGVATGGTTGTIGSTGGTLIDNPTGLGTVSVITRGSGYSVNDVLTLATGTGGTVKVTAVTSGAVTAVEIVTPGTGYTVNNIEATTVAPAGGTGCTIKILTTNAKNWDVNRWAGYKVKILAGKGVSSFPNECLIVSNTANTLQLANSWVFKGAPDATTVYAIMDNWGVCTAAGVATAAATTGGTTYRVGDILLLTTGVGAIVKVLTVTGTGVPATYLVLNPGSGHTATSGIATTCFTNTAASATITTTITAAGGSTIWNDPYQNWGGGATTLQGQLVGKYVRPLTAAPATGIDYAITQVTNATQILTSAVTPDGNTAYAILGVAPRNATASLGVSCLMRLYGTTVVEKARYMVSWRGNNTPSIDRYDIVQDQWETLGTPPSYETYTLGSMFTYNGKDRIYFTAGVTNRVMYLDLVTNYIVPCSTVPYGHSTGLPGNRMFVMSNTDLVGQNLEYLYVMRHSGQEMWRALIFW